MRDGNHRIQVTLRTPDGQRVVKAKLAGLYAELAERNQEIADLKVQEAICTDCIKAGEDILAIRQMAGLSTSPR